MEPSILERKRAIRSKAVLEVISLATGERFPAVTGPPRRKGDAAILVAMRPGWARDGVPGPGTPDLETIVRPACEVHSYAIHDGIERQRR